MYSFPVFQSLTLNSQWHSRVYWPNRATICLINYTEIQQMTHLHWSKKGYGIISELICFGATLARVPACMCSTPIANRFYWFGCQRRLASKHTQSNGEATITELQVNSLYLVPYGRWTPAACGRWLWRWPLAAAVGTAARPWQTKQDTFTNLSPGRPSLTDGHLWMSPRLDTLSIGVCLNNMLNY